MSAADHRVQKDLKSIRLLIADDDLMTQVIMKNIFKKLGWDSDIVGNGLEVLEKMKHADYDLILMDVEMPELDGYQTTIKIRNDLRPPLSNIPIIAITAYATDVKLKKCLEVGMDDYMIKPLNAAELRIKIKKMLNRTGDDNTLDEPLTEGSGSKPIIDLQSLYAACGDPGTVKNIINLFVAQTPANIQQLKEFIITEDWQNLGKICHKMKASYALIGIPEIKNYLQEIEDDCEKNTVNVSKLESYLTIIKEINAKAIHELESHLEKR
jgi:CheY-like chemotaxis protein/HPt (histidine-containing phosphotransfer) domain-containing protein